MTKTEINWRQYLSKESRKRETSDMNQLIVSASKPGTISLGGGLPHPLNFPFRSLSFEYLSLDSDFKKNKSLVISNQSDLTSTMQYADNQGLTCFYDLVKNFNRSFNKPNYDTESWDVTISAGTTQALEASFRMLCNPGDFVLFEELCYACAKECAEPMGLVPYPVKIDNEGIIPENLDSLLTNWKYSYFGGEKPKVIYVVPTGQNPTGVSMSKERRIEFMKIAAKHDLIVIEDDPYYWIQLSDTKPTTESYFNQMKKYPTLLSLDKDGRVIRLDSVSKLLAPGSRLGWITSNSTFIRQLSLHNEVNIQTASGFSQMLVFQLLKQWELESKTQNNNDNSNPFSISSASESGFITWLRHLSWQYSARYHTLSKYFEQYIPKDLCYWSPVHHGMFLWLNININKFQKPLKYNNKSNHKKWCKILEQKLYSKIISNGLVLSRGIWFQVKNPIDDDSDDSIAFRVTFASADVDQMELAAKTLGKSLENVKIELESEVENED